MAFRLSEKAVRTLAHSAPAEGEYYVDAVLNGEAWQVGPVRTIDESIATARRMAAATGRVFRTEHRGGLVLLINGLEESYCAGTTVRRDPAAWAPEALAA